MTGIAWPSVLKPRAFGYFPIEADQSGGAASGGGEQFVQSPGPRWGARGTFDVKTNEQVLALRSLRGQLKGRAVPVQLPNFDGKRVSWPEETFNGDPTGVILTPRVTRNQRLDGTVYADPEIPDDSEIEAEVYADALARATTLVIVITQGGAPLAGQQFGLSMDGLYADAPRLHEIVSVSHLTSPSRYSLTIYPPLRTEPKDGDPVLFTRPACLMRCMNLNDELRDLDLLRFATLNLEFQEYLPPGGA